MHLLGIETSTRRLSAALWSDGVVLARSSELPNGGSGLLLPWIRELLDEAGLAPRQLNGLAFGAGPGGFTGIRLACGMAQGLAWGLDLPLLPVSTLEALALASGHELVWTCLDARMNEVYSAAYRVESDTVIELMSPVCVAPDLVEAPPGGPMWGVGDGFKCYFDQLRSRGSGLLGVLPDAYPSAEAVVRIAAPRLAAGRTLTAGMAHPIYVRDKVALTTAERMARGGSK